MKNLTISLVTILGLLVFASCEDSVGPKINSDPGSPALTSHQGGESYELNENNADEVLLTLSWSTPDFGFAAAVTYIIEMDAEGSDFENAVQFAETNQTSLSMTVNQVNTRLLTAGVPFGIQSDTYFRIRAHVNDAVEDRISETFMLAFTPYEVIIDFPEIFVPGSYQSASGYTNDWSPADAPALTSVNSDDRYEGYVYVANDGSMFKFTEDRSWDVNWGDDGQDGTLQQNGADIPADAGYFKINVNLSNMTYSILNTTWGIIGDATANGWDADQDMEYDVDDKVWRITTDLAAGELKFRANDGWDLNYGDNDGTGTLQDGGGNIPVEEAGNYTIELDLSGAIYRYSLTMN